MKQYSEITKNMVAEFLEYCPKTGVFTWLKRAGVRKPGEEAGYIAYDGYRYIYVCGVKALAHRLAFLLTEGKWPKDMVDHINGDKSDNTWNNLRHASRSMNAQNQKVPQISNKSCGFLGVTRKREKWQAQIGVNKKRIYLGTFATPEEASKCYLKAKRELHSGNTL